MRRIQALTVLTALLLVGADLRNSDAASPASAIRSAEPADACDLLTEADVSKALEGKSYPGKHVIEGSPKFCAWSDDPNGAMTSRRVSAQYIAVAGFDAVKSRAGKITIEPLSGIGDDAYYVIGNGVTPFLAVKKGKVAIQIRVLNGKKAFTVEQEKAKEAELAKAAVGKL